MARQDDDDFDGFIQHKGSSAFSGGEMLTTKWHKLGKIDLWLYTRISPKPFWRHGWQQIKVREDKQTRAVTKEVWGDNWNCHEPEETLKDRNRDKETGEREKPIVYCPFCNFLEIVRRLVRDEKLDWKAPIFIFKGDDPAKKQVIHAGGCYNGYSKVTRGSEQAKELAEHGIYVKNAFRENLNSKLAYLFLVVQHEKPAGLQIAIEGEMVGRAVQKMIRKAREALKGEEGNPFKNPYMVRWTYDESAERIDDKYDATRMEREKLPEAIEKLIRAPRKMAPDISRLLQFGDKKTLRALMERHATKALKAVIDWDEVFDVKDRKDVDHDEGKKTSDDEPEEKTSKKTSSSVSTKKSADKKVKKVPCEDCGTLMLPNATKCPNKECGAEYEAVDDEDAEDHDEEDEDEEDEKPSKKSASKKKPLDAEEEEDDDEDEDEKPSKKSASKKKPVDEDEDDEEEEDDEDEDEKPAKKKTAKKKPVDEDEDDEDDEEAEDEEDEEAEDEEEEDEPPKRSAKKSASKKSSKKSASKKDDDEEEDDDDDDDDDLPF